MTSRDVCFRGIASGYHPCCVRWFEIRLRLISGRVLEFRNKINNAIVSHPWIQPHVGRYMSWRYSDRVQHVQCPYHRVFDRHPKYMTCEICDWHQLDRWDGRCLRCDAILELEVVKILNEYHYTTQEGFDRLMQEEHGYPLDDDEILPCVLFYIPLETAGLGSAKVNNALEVRLQIKADMLEAGLNVDGIGMAEDGMEIFVYSEDPKAAVKTGQNIIKKFGMQSEYLIKYPDDDDDSDE